MIHVAFVLMAPLVVQARLGRSAVKEGASVEAEGSLQVLAAVVAPPAFLTVELQRVNTHNQPDIKGNFYVGHLAVGKPATDFSVLFHTLSGHIMVPHIACKTLACLGHKQFSPWDSSSAVDVQVNGSMVSEGHRLAEGKHRREAVVMEFRDSELGAGTAKAYVIQDHVCLANTKIGENQPGELGCVDMELLAATQLPDQPFKDMPSDGIVGLGLPPLGAGPLCSFFGRFMAGHKNMLPRFGFSLGSTRGDIHLGGLDETRFIPPLRWLPVEDPEQGFWQINIRSVRIGNTIVDSCEKGCHGVVDTGASLLGVNSRNLVKFKTDLAAHIEKEDGKLACFGPELIFDLGDFTLALPPNDYTNDECVPQIGPVEVSEESTQHAVYQFGAPLLRRYYAAFDWDQKRVGFARTSADASPKNPKAFLST